MKKLFNYALLAAALLVGVNVNAQTPVCELTMNGSTKQLTSLYEAFDIVTTAALQKSRSIAPEAYIDHETDFYEAVDLADSTVATIKLLANATLDAGRYAHIDGFKYVLNAGERITIDLNGKTLTSNVRFNIFQASLYFVNTNAQVATINTDNDKVSQFLNAYGSRDKDADYGFCRIVLGKNIVFNNPNGFGMCFFPNDYYFAKFNGTPYGAMYGPCAGTTIDIYGEIRCDSYGISGNGYLTVKEGNIPVITLHEGAKLITTAGPCIYAPAYAIYNIHGYVEGASGIYIKAGEFNIDGATIVATSTEHTDVKPNENGTTGGDGAGIVIDSHSGYGQIGDIDIANTTVISNATGGYAIEEVATQGGTKLPDISIESGTFVGGITTTTEERQHIIDSGSITGGEWHNSDIDEYIDKDNYTTLDFVDGEGKTYQIVVPIKETDWSQSIAVAATQTEKPKYAKVAADEEVSTNTTVEFVRILTGKKVTVKSGATLDAGTLMTEGTAQIIVEAGGTLIVSGKQGAYTYDANSLVIKSTIDEENKIVSGQILINPAVVLNTTPKATVEFVGGSYSTGTEFVFDFFGAPFVAGSVTSFIASGTNYSTQLDVNRGGTTWDRIGTIVKDVYNLNLTKFDTPFGFYQLTSNNPSDALQTYTMQGKIFGNVNENVNFRNGWPGFSNAYMANADLVAFGKVLKDQNCDQTIYTYRQTGPNTLTWDPNNIIDMEVDHLRPMQAFMLRNAGAAKKINTDYAAMVWEPVQTGHKAPRMMDMSKVSIRVEGANGVYDRVTIAQSEQFSAEYENGYDAEKYMNSEINLYVKGEKDLAIMASDNVEYTYIAFNCKNAGKYTMTFNKLQGESFVLVDTKTNAHIAMAEGTTYDFIANAGEDAYRFMIVRGAQAPTDMQKTNAAVKANKALVNGQIVISNGERFFNVLGNEVK